jgi:hypothetical protein
METSIKETFIELPDSLLARWDMRLARLISDVFCPPVMIILGIVLIVYSIHDLAAWLWAIFVISLTIGIPVGYIIWKVRIGAISDFHIPIRTQRFRPMLVAVICILLTWAAMRIGKAPGLLISLVGVGAIHTAIMLVITLRWKISGHSSAITALIALLVHLMGPALLPGLALIPLIAWARIRLRRHTLAQTIAGAVSGLIYITMVLR